MKDRAATMPESWAPATIGDICTALQYGYTASASDEPCGPRLLRITDIQNGLVQWPSVPYCQIESEQIHKYQLHPGDIVFARTGGTVGKSFIISSVPESSVFASYLIRLSAHSNVEPKYLYHFFQTASYWEQIGLKKGGLQGNVNATTLSSLELPICPLNEQHRIVAKIEELFSELDKGIENLKTAQAQLKVYRQALLKHAFEGKLTAQWRAEKKAVIPAKAGIQPLNDMDSRLRGNDEVGGGNDESLETADALLKRIQQERAQRYRQQLADWEAAGKQGSKPKAPKSLPPLTAEELAELPDGWISLSVENLFDIEDGDRGEYYPTKGDFSDVGHCLFLNAKNVTKRGFAFQETSFISEQKHLELRKGTLKRGDIVFTSRGTLGNIAHYNDSIKYEHVRINSGMFIIRDYDISLTPDFLYYHLNAPIITSQIEKLQSGTAQPQLPIREFKSFRFVIPSKEEQQQIVQELESKLSEVDQLELTISTSLQQAEALLQSILKRAFSGQLVPQDPHDEPASALLARIRAEREVGAKNAQTAAKPRKSSTGDKLSPTEISSVSTNKEP